PTGSGKTTLLRIIDLLDEPTSGQLFFDGIEVAGISEKRKLEIRRRMAMVFQNPETLKKMPISTLPNMVIF
ncbi:MAG: ATP-binding cassette domain-containing protein, partial [Methanotrichaceae archaeon]|nr:ATP-binding cassette domain-containing protein [Methanotrichaceae archaeon]